MVDLIKKNEKKKTPFKHSAKDRSYTPKFLNIRIISETDESSLKFIKEYGYDTNYLNLKSKKEKQIKEVNGDILYEMSEFTKNTSEKIIVEIFNFKNKEINSRYTFLNGKYKKEI